MFVNQLGKYNPKKGKRRADNAERQEWNRMVDIFLYHYTEHFSFVNTENNQVDDGRAVDTRTTDNAQARDQEGILHCIQQIAS